MLELPPNATPEIKKSLSTHYTQMRYFKIDTVFKSMKLLGAMDLPEETTDANALSWSGFPLHEEGGWKWHVFDGLDIQFKLNADNTVMRMCNFKDKKVRETGDPTANMSYFLAKSRPGDKDGSGGSAVAPGFDPKPPDRTIKKHKELNMIIGGKKNQFRSTMPDAGPVEIRYKYDFKEVLQVDTEKEMFGAIVVIQQEWPITKPDAADYVASTDRHYWTPKSFMPPELEVDNEAKDPTHLQVTAKKSRCKVKVRPSDNMVVVTRKLTFEGDFWEPFELNSYPFDVQPLKVVLKSETIKKSVCEFIPSTRLDVDEYKSPRDTEWWTRSTASGTRFETELEEDADEFRDDEYKDESSSDEEDNASLLSETMEEHESLAKIDPSLPTGAGAAGSDPNDHATSRLSTSHLKMTEPPISPFPGPKSPAGFAIPEHGPDSPIQMPSADAELEAVEASKKKKVGFLDVAETLGGKVKRRREKRDPVMAGRSMSLFDPTGSIKVTLEAVVQRYYQVHIVRVVVVMALFSLTSLFSLSLDPEVHCMDRMALLVTLLLTASTYQITIAAELPALGYLTFIDKYVLITFFFIFLVMIEVALTELVPATNDKSCDYDFNAEKCDPTEVRMTVYGYFLMADAAMWVLMHAAITLWIWCVIIPYEQNKSDAASFDTYAQTMPKYGSGSELDSGAENPRFSLHHVMIGSDPRKKKKRSSSGKGFFGGSKKKRSTAVVMKPNLSMLAEGVEELDDYSDTSEVSIEFNAGKKKKAKKAKKSKKNNKVGVGGALDVPGAAADKASKKPSLAEPRKKKTVRNSLEFPPGIDLEQKPQSSSEVMW